MWEIFLDSLLDSLKIFPFLFLIYLIMEIIEAKHDAKKTEKLFTGRFAPLLGSVTGIVPECGFSAMFSKLYDNGLITTGTLLAVFLSSSDEGLIVLLAGGNYLTVLLLVAIKVVYSALVGYIVNALFGKSERLRYGEIGEECMECGENPEGVWRRYLLHPLLHAVKIFVFIFIVALVFGIAIYLVGEDKINAFLTANAFLQPLAAALVGLIPNCSASVLIAQGYNVGAITFAGLTAGLTTNAGVGLILLFKNKKRLKNNLFITGMLFLTGALLGYGVMLFL